MTTVEFDKITDKYGYLAALPTSDVSRMLRAAGIPPKSNFMEAVLTLLRLEFTSEKVDEWINCCAKVGVLI